MPAVFPLKVNWVALGSLETGQAGEEDGVGAEGTLTQDQMLTDPEEAADFVSKTHVMHWLSPVAPAMVPINLAAHPQVIFSLSIASKQLTNVFPVLTLVMHGSSSCLRNGWLLLISTVAKFPRPTACPLSRFAKALTWRAQNQYRHRFTPCINWRRAALSGRKSSGL